NGNRAGPARAGGGSPGRRADGAGAAQRTRVASYVGSLRLPRRQALQSAIHPDQECAMLVDDIEGIRRILSSYKTVAMVGLSANWHRPSNFAAKYLLDHGFRVIPVNPAYDEVLGQRCYP